ncbi:MAG TPA: tetratricopeptide repeat protein, partial [Adhaeribacter sp.]|nr:tetratricopeptide repeat protein [Adhaeribacter sp.]
MIKNWKYALLMTGTLFSFTAHAQTLQDGKRALEMERYKEAKSKLAKVLKTNNNEITNITMGDVYLETGKQDSAVYYYRQAAAKDAKSAMGMVAAGKAALVQGNTAEAEKQFDAALKRSKSKDADVLLQMAAAYFDTDKNLNKAAEHATASIVKNRTNPEAYILLGDIYLKQNKGGDAMNNYE